MRLAAILAAGAMFVATPAAHAADMKSFRMAQAIAGAYFVPQCGPVMLRWAPVGGASSPDAVPSARANPEGCSVTFAADSWRMPWGLLCATMVHEYGHLAGYAHSSSKRSIMYPSVRFEPRRCKIPGKATMFFFGPDLPV